MGPLWPSHLLFLWNFCWNPLKRLPMIFMCMTADSGWGSSCSGVDCLWGIYAMGVNEITAPEDAEEPHHMFSDLCWWKCCRPQMHILRPKILDVSRDHGTEWVKGTGEYSCAPQSASPIKMARSHKFHLWRNEEAACFHYFLRAPDVFFLVA